VEATRGAGPLAALERVPPAVLLGAAALLQALGWTGLLLRRRLGLAAASLATGLLLGGALAVRSLEPRGAEAVVLRDDARVRREPHAEVGIVATLDAGELVRVLASSPRWSRVRRGGDLGWTETENLVPVAFDPHADERR
jgi:hypothetical protein